MVQMFGWFSADAARASRRKRSRACGSCERLVGQELEGHETAEGGVFRFVDHAHATAAQKFHNAVVGNGLSDHGGARWRSGAILRGKVYERQC